MPSPDYQSSRHRYLDGICRCGPGWTPGSRRPNPMVCSWLRRPRCLSDRGQRHDRRHRTQRLQRCLRAGLSSARKCRYRRGAPMRMVTINQLIKPRCATTRHRRSPRHRVFPKIQYIVPGIIPEGLSMLVGRPKIGKSWMALDIGISIASGRSCLGGRVPQEGDVLYVARGQSASPVSTHHQGARCLQR